MDVDRHSDQLAENLLACASGDLLAFRSLYEATAPRLLAICFTITRDKSAAEDVLQTVYVKIWQSAEQFDPARARPMTWLASIARNTAIDWFRAQRPTREASDQSLETVSSTSEAVDDRIVREEGEKQALGFVHDLDEDLKSQVRRIYLEGMTYAEIAERDGVPIGTLKSRVRRALISIRMKLHDD